MRFSELSEEDVAAILEHMNSRGLTDWDMKEGVHIKMPEVDPGRLSPELKYY